MMRIPGDIIDMVEALKRADIPMANLCFEMDEHDWHAFLLYVQGFARYQDADLSYTEEATYMGLKVRKRSSERRSGDV